MFIIEYRKSPTMLYSKIKSKFFFLFASRHGYDEDQYVTKMALSANMGGL
jgi:hypothetical protein